MGWERDELGNTEEGKTLGWTAGLREGREEDGLILLLPDAWIRFRGVSGLATKFHAVDWALIVRIFS